MFGLSKKATMAVGVGGGLLALYLLGDGAQRSAAETTADATQCRVTVVADVLNVRAAPALDAPIVGKFTKDAETDADKLVENGFRKLADDRWAANEFLAPKQGHDCGS